MNRPITDLTTLTASLILSFSATAQAVEAYHNVDAVEHQNQYVALGNLGYRMDSLSIYGTAGNLRYAAVWVQRPGPNFVAIHEATGVQYQDFFDTYCPQGYTPTILTATGSGANERFAAVLELTNTPCNSYHGLTQQQFFDQRNTELQNGNQIVAVDVYGSNADPRYTVAFAPKSVGQTAIVSAGNADFQDHFDALTEGHARPSLVAFNDDERFVSLWRSDSVGAWAAHHDLTGTEYQNHADAYALQNAWPISVQASGSGSGIRYAAVFARTDEPQLGTFVATGPDVPELAAFDQWAEDWMTENEVRAASLAITYRGRLMLTRGYTQASEPGYPETQPDSLFEIASCSKPLTSIAIHQAFEDPMSGLAPGDTMLTYFPGQSPQSMGVNSISVYHLLTHQGGWDRNATTPAFDPMVFQDEAIATAQGAALPIAKQDIVDFVIDTQSLDFTPGTDRKYSNFGFMLLGRILESVNGGMDYEQIVQQNVFAPLGVTRPSIRGSLKSGLAADEVSYHPYDPWLQRSVMSPAQPWVAAQYGDLNYDNMEAHGGWRMAAPDFAKVLASFDTGSYNPILGQDQTDDMWTLAPGSGSFMSGWFLRNVDDGDGGTVEMYCHSGLLLGSTALVCRRADDISFVFFANGQKRSLSRGTEGQQLSDLANTIQVWPNHDLFPRVGLPECREYVHGNVVEFGDGCGDPTLGPTVLDVAGDPDIGQVLQFEMSNTTPGAPCALMIGFSNPGLNLHPLQAFGCVLYVDPVAFLNDTIDAGGSAKWDWQVPESPAAIGATLFFQGIAADPFANPFGLVFTTAAEVTIGGWL